MTHSANPQTFDEAFFRDPYPAYRRMQEHDEPFPLFVPGDNSDQPLWLFTRYADVKDILRNAQGTSQDIKKLIPESQRNAFHYMLLYSDPPDHSRLRSLVDKPFSKQNVASLEQFITSRVNSLIDEMLAKDEVDFVRDFAVPFPVDVISHMLGTPFEVLDQLRDWAMIIGRGSDSTVASISDMADGQKAMVEMSQFFKQQFERSDLPVGSIMETLASSADQSRCSPEETTAQCMLLLLAGHETTVNLLASGLYLLLSHPEEQSKLLRNPALLDSAVNEMLRYEPPIQRAIFRVTTEPLQLSQGTLQPGQRLSPVLSAANRDPAQFQDPNRFDIERTPNRHLSFSLGIHRCLGEKLARLEAQVAFSCLLPHLPRMELVDEQPRWQQRSLFRALDTLPIRFR